MIFNVIFFVNSFEADNGLHFLLFSSWSLQAVNQDIFFACFCWEEDVHLTQNTIFGLIFHSANIGMRCKKSINFIFHSIQMSLFIAIIMYKVDQPADIKYLKHLMHNLQQLNEIDRHK